MSGGGYPTYQLASGSDPVDLCVWDDMGGDMLLAQDTSLSGQFAQQWEPHMMAQEASLKGVATSKLRRFLAYNKSFSCTDVTFP